MRRPQPLRGRVFVHARRETTAGNCPDTCVLPRHAAHLAFLFVGKGWPVAAAGLHSTECRGHVQGHLRASLRIGPGDILRQGRRGIDRERALARRRERAGTAPGLAHSPEPLQRQEHEAVREDRAAALSRLDARSRRGVDSYGRQGGADRSQPCPRLRERGARFHGLVFQESISGESSRFHRGGYHEPAGRHGSRDD